MFLGRRQGLGVYSTQDLFVLVICADPRTYDWMKITMKSHNLVAILRQWIIGYDGFFHPEPLKGVLVQRTMGFPSLKVLLLATKKSKKVSNKNK